MTVDDCKKEKIFPSERNNIYVFCMLFLSVSLVVVGIFEAVFVKDVYSIIPIAAGSVVFYIFSFMFSRSLVLSERCIVFNTLFLKVDVAYEKISYIKKVKTVQTRLLHGEESLDNVFFYLVKFEDSFRFIVFGKGVNSHTDAYEEIVKKISRQK